MSEEQPRPITVTMSFEEVTISNMWEIATLLEILLQKGICTKHDFVSTLAELRDRSLSNLSGETDQAVSFLTSRTEESVVDDLLAVLNTNGLDSKRSLDILHHVRWILEMGTRDTPQTTH